MSWQRLFSEHLQSRKSTVETILSTVGYDGIVIDAGVPGLYYEDDQRWVHRPNHHFAHWCPIAAPGSLLAFFPGKKPILFFVSPQDYWHDSPELGPEFWQSEFDIRIVGSEEDAWKGVRGSKNCIYHGPRSEEAKKNGLIIDVVATLWARLNWERSFKSEYEVESTLHATTKSARGHKAAKAAFEAGASEREIYFDYLTATGDPERELPYGSIVCLDDKCSILHYTQQRTAPRNGKVLLIDAGAQTNRYACDITRTYYLKECMGEFRAIVDGVDSLQQLVCNAAAPGKSMVDLHGLAHEKIAELLIQTGVLRDVSAEAALAKGLTNVFFPHGVGHMLGLMVHDVAGKQQDAVGTAVATKHLENDPRYKFLRSHRVLEAGNLVTVEPGVYFINMLLVPHRTGADKNLFRWSLIDDLIMYGGVRIEDDVLITASGHRNLTREILG